MRRGPERDASAWLAHEVRHMENKGFYINDLPQSGEVTFLAAVIEKELRPKRNGGSFLSVRLADRSGELDAKAWENPEAVAQLFDCNDVVKVRVAMVRDEPLRQLLESIVNDASINQRLKTVPAAMKIHHAFRGGLLEHVLSLCNLAAALTAHYPCFNLDWLIAGAILHDLGKIETLELTGVRFAYTTRGQLIEHVTLGLEIIERHVGRFPGFPLELKTILQHFIVSHHGDLDKGALRRPMLPEALALSLLDLMDARLEQVFRLIDSAPAGEEFTSYVPSLERQLFRGFGEQAEQSAKPQTIEGGKAA